MGSKDIWHWSRSRDVLLSAGSQAQQAVLVGAPRQDLAAAGHRYAVQPT